MASKKGRGLLMVYAGVPAEHEEEFNRWYDEEHIAEMLSIPGVLDAARYVALQGSPKYLACYELDEPETWHSDVFQHRVIKNPTEWSKRMSPGGIGVNFISNLYRLIFPNSVTAATAHADMAPVLLVGRMSVPLELEGQFNHAYNTERLPMCYRVPGYIRGRRFQAVTGEPKYTTVHELESTRVSNSPEWDAWRTAVTPVWSEKVRPRMTHVQGSPGVYSRIFPP